jgi:single-strand DNA-binding protein
MLNKIMLIGNLGRDPELTVTGDGVPLARFSLAVSRNYKSSSGERKEETEWFNIVAWRQLAEVCDKYLHKGSKVYIEGRVQQRKYTDREGAQRTAFDVVASDMQMLDRKETSGGTGSYASGGASSGNYGSSSSGNIGSAPADDFDPFLDEDELP